MGFEGTGREARIRSRVKGGQTGWVQETQQEEELGKKKCVLNITLCHRYKPWGHSCRQDRHGSCCWVYRLLMEGNPLMTIKVEELTMRNASWERTIKEAVIESV